MAKNSFDQFSKQFLEEFLSPLGTVETSLEVAGEPQFVDVYFVPSAQAAKIPTDLGILGRMLQTPCLIEPFRNQPTLVEVRSCLLKLFQVHGDYHRRAKRSSESLPEGNLPQLWILASSASEALLYKFGAISEEKGVYFLPEALRTAIVSINQLPCDESTLWLRLLGKGRTQEQAIAEVIAFDAGDPRRSSILRLLANWKISIEVTGQVAEEEELMMALSQAYLEWEQRTEQRGAAQEAQLLVLRQLKRRIGELSPVIQTQIQALSLAQIESLGEALLDFVSAEDLSLWMQRNS
jgi:Domain of unknown function (DUF4351)